MIRIIEMEDYTSPTYTEQDHIASEATFEKELSALINIYSIENDSNTPDFILAQYMQTCLSAFNTALQQRETWCCRDARPLATNSLTHE